MLLLLLPTSLAAPLFSVDRGLQETPFTLELAAEAGGSLYYSLDLSSPSLPYTGPLSIDRTSVVRAVEVAADGTSSDIVTATYLFVDDIVTSSVMDPTIVGHETYGPIVAETLRALPSVSLVAPAGITMTEGPVSVEWMDPDGASTQVNAGAYVSGGTSWQYAKTSFRLVFRGAYGPGRLHLDLFGEDADGLPPADDHDALSLRGGNHDTVFYLGSRGQHLRNLWMDTSQLEMGHIAPHGRFIHVYRNGVYHGLYHLRERFNAAMLAEYLGGEEEDYEAVTAGNAFDGSGAAWAALVASSTSFEAAEPWLDVDNFLDYMVLNFYAGNAWDWWPTHNWAAAGPAEPGAGGFRFHSSDNDICLAYDYTVNILGLGGPSYLFSNLLAESHPDFRVALVDAIHRNLTGPLSTENATARYERLAASAEDGIVAESARWGFGWWDRDGEWAVERDALLSNWFPYRTDELWRQVREAGWYPVEAPELDTESGLVSRGTEVVASAPTDSTAELWVTLDGSDPRQRGGAVSTSALGPDGARVVPIDTSTQVRARLREGETWGPIVEAFYEVDAAPAVVLNEWNAVEEGSWLDDDGADDALGRLAGNGGDWIELLILRDIDLRGASLEMVHRAGDAGSLVFTDDPLLAHLRAGTLLTIAEDLPEDASYDPDGGDWRFHLRAGADGSGRYITAAPFDVSSREWQLVLRDGAGGILFGPVGEGVSPVEGISGKEVGALKGTPDADFRRTSDDYRGVTRSTYGAPNVWDDGEQDLSALRGRVGGVVDLSDSGAEDTGAAVTPFDEDSGGQTPSNSGCGCGTPPAAAGSALLPLGLLLLRRRR
jgi:hypothetical protein